MRSPALAIAWEFRRRHRWGLLAIAAYFLALGAIRLIVPDLSRRVDDAEEVEFAFAVLVPLTAAFFYVIAVFSFGLAGDLAARRSMYPARMFTLPVTTAALAGWPMLFGTTIIAALWLVTERLVVWPSGFDAPVWPALFAAVFLAWTQVLMWLPYGLTGLRVVAAVLSLFVLDIAGVLAVEYKPAESLMFAVLAPQILLAYLAACYAVASGRRGEVPDWRVGFARLGEATHLLSRQKEQFASPARAQSWYEWRCLGRSLPTWVAILLPFELALLWVVRDTPSLIMGTMMCMLLTPPIMAVFAAATPRDSGPDGGSRFGLTPFIATRPVGTATMAAAKLGMAMRSTLAAWALLIVAVPLGLSLSGTWPVVIDEVRGIVNALGMARTVAVSLLVVAALVGSTWKQLVQGLCVALTGREWLVKSTVFIRLSILIVVVPAVHWLLEDYNAVVLLYAIPWILGGIAALKVTCAVVLASRLFRSRVVADRALVAGAASWSLVVLAVYGALVWLMSTPAVIPRYIPALIAILAVPLVRPAATLMALVWNRQRGSQPPAATKTGKMPFLTVCLLIAFPAAMALGQATSFYVLNRNNGVIVTSGQRREYLLYVPESYDHTKPTPLVISLHGGMMWPSHQQEVSHWNEVAEAEGLIVVYPSGTTGKGPRRWAVDVGAQNQADVAFISDLIDTLKSSYNLDPTRIYADGFSNGGGMAFALSCTMSDRIAAVGMVASAQFRPWTSCTDRHAVPMIAFHGTADKVVPYHGGRSWVAPKSFPDFPTWVATWARRNGCAPTPVDEIVAPDVVRRSFVDGEGDASVVLYTIDGGGHTWPGGEPLPEWIIGRTSNSIDATRLMWAFFRDHPLRTGAVSTKTQRH